MICVNGHFLDFRTYDALEIALKTKIQKSTLTTFFVFLRPTLMQISRNFVKKWDQLGSC